MSEKRFVLEISSFSDKHMKFLNILDNGKRLKSEDIVDLLNEQQEQISYWKHRVNGLLWILSQFDEEKVKELLKELEDE